MSMFSAHNARATRVHTAQHLFGVLILGADVDVVGDLCRDFVILTRREYRHCGRRRRDLADVLIGVVCQCRRTDVVDLFIAFDGSCPTCRAATAGAAFVFVGVVVVDVVEVVQVVDDELAGGFV